MDTKPRGRGTGWVIGQFVLLAAIALAPPGLLGLPAWPEPLRRGGVVAGALLMLAGAVLALGGVRTLDRNLTPFPRPIDDGTLVEHGVYSRVRHPIYSGIIFGSLGWALLRASTPGLLLAGVLGLFFDRKAAYEERWLAHVYPGYAAYRQRVKKLIPWVY